MIWAFPMRWIIAGLATHLLVYHPLAIAAGGRRGTGGSQVQAFRLLELGRCAHVGQDQTSQNNRVASGAAAPGVGGIYPSDSHSRREMPAYLRISARRLRPMSPRWGLGIFTVTSPRLMIS